MRAQTANIELENEAFRNYLRAQNPDKIDALVFAIQERVTPLIDCTTCGNCCRSLLINVEPNEIRPVQTRLGITEKEFRLRYIEESSQGQMVINTIPCHFLHDSKCTVYEDRFTECREFPHLHKPGFTRRLFGTLMHYDRCAIISTTIEILKDETNFTHE